MRIKRDLPELFDDVIDVGVQGLTDYLVAAAAESFHHLIEPATEYHSMLLRNYEQRDIRHRLYPIALSDTSNVMFLHKLSNNHSGNVTHTQILPERDDEKQNLLGIDSVTVSTLDETFPEGALKPFTYIVKIDVDGVEEKIIRGGGRVLSKAAIVAIEAPVSTIFQRISMLRELGLKLFDITELCYYDDALWQVDLIFVHESILERTPSLSPLRTAQNSGGVDFDYWFPLNRVMN